MHYKAARGKKNSVPDEANVKIILEAHIYFIF